MKRKTLAINLGLVLVSIAFALVLVEFGYRFYLFGSDSVSLAKVNSFHPLGVSGLIQASPYPEVVFELKPHLDTYFKMARFTTNARGLRDGEYPLVKTHGAYRIAVIGDSFTMASGVAVEDAYHSVLEERLNAAQGRWSYEVINFGVGGYDLRQYVAVMRTKTSEYDPDLILVGYCPDNDHEIRSDLYFEQTYRPKPRSHPAYRSFVRWQLRRLSRSPRKRISLSEETKDYVAEMLGRMQVLSVERDIPVVIMFLWHGDDAHWRRYSRDLEQLARSHDLGYVDLSRAFAGTNMTDYDIYPIDNHPNAAAHRIFADQLYTFLNSTVLPEKAGTTRPPTGNTIPHPDEHR